MAELKSFVCIRNEFGQSSVESIAPVLSRPLPGQLDELKLISCPKLCSTAINRLLDALIEKSFVKSLSLVDAGINEDLTVRKLITYMTTSRHLQKLDISWNGLKQH